MHALVPLQVGMNTALDWFLGNAGFSQVVGIIGGFDSDVTMAIASNGAVFEVPQVWVALVAITTMILGDIDSPTIF